MQKKSWIDNLRRCSTPRYMHILFEFDEFEPRSIAHLEGAMFPLPTRGSLKRWVEEHGDQYKSPPTLTDVLSAYILAKLTHMGVLYNGMAKFKEKHVRVYFIKQENLASPAFSQGKDYTIFVKLGWLCKRSIPDGIKISRPDLIFKKERQCRRTMYYGKVAENMESLTGESK